jgi:hypothetical protein
VERARPELWRRTTIYLRRALAAAAGTKALRVLPDLDPGRR